jgi:hypothetical protein
VHCESKIRRQTGAARFLCSLLMHISETGIGRLLCGLLMHILETGIGRFLCGLLMHIHVLKIFSSN